MPDCCRTSHSRHSWTRHHLFTPPPKPPPSLPHAEAVSAASAALQIVLHFAKSGGGVALANDAIFCAVAGFPQRPLPAGHPALATDPSLRDKLLEAIVHMIKLPGVSLRAHAEAISRHLLSSNKRNKAPLHETPENVFHMAKELLLAKRLYCCGAPNGTLKQLADPHRAPPRAEFAAAFGLRLPRPTRFREPKRAIAAVTDHDNSLPSLLARMRPPPDWAPLAVFDSPLAYFIQCGVNHFAEAYTSEGIHALATYLKSRQDALASQSRTIVEIGAGDGRLSHLLNGTGLLSPPIIATDPAPQPSPFKVEKLDDKAAMRTHKPSLLLCAWMSHGDDWTPKWRHQASGVAEYVLIGSLGGYSLSDDFDHSPFERVPLHEAVSQHLLTIEQGREGQPDELGGVMEPLDDESWSRVCAVAFRRCGVVR